MRTIEDIVTEWVHEFGIEGRGKNGPYRYIAFSQKKDLLLTLARTLMDEGYGKEDLKLTSTQNLIVNACEAPDGASSRSLSKIRKSKQITASNWKYVIVEFFRGSFSTHTSQKQNTTIETSPTTVFESPKPVEKVLEIDPADRLKIDTSNCAKKVLDTDFLSEIGLDESFFKGTPNE